MPSPTIPPAPTGNPTTLVTGSRPAATGSFTPATPAPNRQRNALLVTGGAIALALVLFLLLKASGVLGAKKTEIPTTAVLSAPKTQVTDAPILAAPEVKQPNAPVLTPPQVVGNPMPEDVIAYLRWLKKFDAARKSLESRGEAQMLLSFSQMSIAPLRDLLKEPDQQSEQIKTAAPETQNDIANLIAEWNKAAGLFQSVAPPNPCATLATKYNTMLGLAVQQQSKLLSVMVTTLKQASDNNGQATPEVTKVLTELMDEYKNKQMSRAADETFIDSNDALNAVRDQYTNIPTDIDRAHFSISDESKVNVPSVGLPAIPGLGT